VQYENPKIPEGINVTREHPLRGAVQLVVGVLGVVALLAAGLAYAAGRLAPLVPFSMEEEVAGNYVHMLPARTPTTDYLQHLADRLAGAQKLPPGMRVRVSFVDDETVNAMATLAGHVFVFRGLLEAMPSENALSMVIAHEVAHVKHRDPLAALGRSVVLGLGLATLGVSSGSDAAGQALGHAGLFTQLRFSRAQEEHADETALAALAAVYGHVRDADHAFEALLAHEVDGAISEPAFARTHPHTRDRIARLRELAKERGYRTDGALTELAVPEASR
jgi:Zn-dependent protease with chaperone function